jgi:hypothetical protein
VHHSRRHPDEHGSDWLQNVARALDAVSPRNLPEAILEFHLERTF